MIWISTQVLLPVPPDIDLSVATTPPSATSKIVLYLHVTVIGVLSLMTDADACSDDAQPTSTPR
jgi:hypothetical protein